MLGWFRENDVEYINSISKINPAERFTEGDRIFDPHDRGTKRDHLVSHLGWILSTACEGGFFILIGHRR